jgi:hypothetical protein
MMQLLDSGVSRHPLSTIDVIDLLTLFLSRSQSSMKEAKEVLFHFQGSILQTKEPTSSYAC